MIQDYNEYKLSNKERLALIMVLVGFLLLAGLLYIDSLITVVISPIAYGFASQRYMSYMIAKRKIRLRNEFKELLYSFSASFAIGSSMQSAMKDGCKKLREIFDEDSIMLGELEDMCSKLESTASDPVFLWEDLAARCVVEDIKLFSEVYRGCTSSGGDMIVAIEAAAKTIGEKIEMENSIKLLAKQKIIAVFSPRALINTGGHLEKGLFRFQSKGYHIHRQRHLITQNIRATVRKAIPIFTIIIQKHPRIKWADTRYALV